VAEPSRWATRWLPLGLAGLVVVLVAAYLLVDGRRGADPGPGGGAATSSELAGEWSGEGSLTDCAGFDDTCSGTRPITLAIDCSAKRCTVTPFDESYGRPPLRFADGRYRAAGPLPPEAAPTCGGVPTHSALWRLELTVAAGRLVGVYRETTQQGFECGATALAWRVTLARG
jgi:hypothetical protein